jgi:hypothetical protein
MCRSDFCITANFFNDTFKITKKFSIILKYRGKIKTQFELHYKLFTLSLERIFIKNVFLQTQFIIHLSVNIFKPSNYRFFSKLPFAKSSLGLGMCRCPWWLHPRRPPARRSGPACCSERARQSTSTWTGEDAAEIVLVLGFLNHGECLKNVLFFVLIYQIDI